MTRKSTDIITTISHHDVLCGRGGLANTWPGNKLFRGMIKENKEIYQELSEHAVRKQLLVSSIIKAIQHHGGRFLRKSRCGNWVEIPRRDAYTKTCQALRDQENNIRYGSDSSTVASEGRVSPSPEHTQFRQALRSTLAKQRLATRTVSTDQEDKENDDVVPDLVVDENTVPSMITTTLQKKVWVDDVEDDLCPLAPHEFIFESVDEFSHLCSNLLEIWGR